MKHPLLASSRKASTSLPIIPVSLEVSWVIKGKKASRHLTLAGNDATHALLCRRMTEQLLMIYIYDENNFRQIGIEITGVFPTQEVEDKTHKEVLRIANYFFRDDLDFATDDEERRYTANFTLNY